MLTEIQVSNNMYYLKKQIETAEEFISKTAARSSLSGKSYLIRCHSREEDCQKWLFAELQIYRNANILSE